MNIDLSDRRYMLRRSREDKKIVAAQVWGARVIASPGPLPISENALEKKGLIWPGFKEPVTDAKAMQMSVADLVYVKDTVLGAYEGRPEFRVNPESGSVTFGTQWSVGFCDRVGRDLIRLELKKLYEGVPPQITREWHSHAVSPPSQSTVERIAKERNVGIRAKDIVFTIAALGESLSNLAEALSLPGLQPEDFVGLRRRALEYHGWWTFDNIESIGRHIPFSLTEDSFLTRCMNLNKLVGEGLSEKSLRLVLRALGVPAKAVESLGSLKLLDCVVRMAQLAEQTGLELALQGQEVWRRLESDGTQQEQPIGRLFALYDLRVLAGHKTGNRHERVTRELKRFGISTSGAGAGYGPILDQVYDLVLRDLEAARSKIDAALAICNPLVTAAEAVNSERVLPGSTQKTEKSKEKKPSEAKETAEGPARWAA